ncbi:hypothetical protein CCZ20_24450 [Priestia aryabhattai]|uniref:hypothetical protein n=1 Tax=Priestia aryabhattai TaxID=412384 RepID=UPI000B4FD596|nr:hypothetical protein [Priestia aryabhattai]OVE34805.1 hypothetical protein CCZ20_24450 [Priestia aryabhattai]
MKTQTINFRDFMENKWRKPAVYSMPVYSFGFTWASFFHMTPEMTGAYLLVSVVGLTAILSNVFENHFASQGADHIADIISKAASVLLPTTFFAFILLFLWRLMA